PSSHPLSLHDALPILFWEVPLTVALHFLGVPEEDMQTLRQYSIAHTVNTWGRPTKAEQLQVADAVGNFWRYAGEVLEKMRQDPRSEEHTSELQSRFDI